MKKIALEIIMWTSIIILLLTIQSLLSFNTFKLNLGILPVFYLGYKRGDIAGLTSGIGTGLIEDILSGYMIGPSILSKGLIGLFAPLLREQFFVWTYLMGIVSIFLITIADELLIYMALTIFSQKPATFSQFAIAAIIKALINSPFGGILKKDEE